jgi:hypothetical protein
MGRTRNTGFCGGSRALAARDQDLSGAAAENFAPEGWRAAWDSGRIATDVPLDALTHRGSLSGPTAHPGAR